MPVKILTAEQQSKNFDIFESLIEKHFSKDKDRYTKIKKLVEHFEDRILTAPASSKEHYHGAHIGGYLEHCLNVYNIAMDMAIIWKKYSENINYTLDEVAFIALFHDLGKLGDIDEPFYLPQDNDWRRKNMGEIFKINPKVVNMNGADRSLYLLQAFDIKLTQNEWITIKIHEGLFDEGNEYYLKAMSESSIIKSHLPHLIHHSDIMAARIEYEQWKQSEEQSNKLVDAPTPKFKQKPTLSDVMENKPIEDVNKLFDDLFKK
jgi:hypothetical protein